MKIAKKAKFKRLRSDMMPASTAAMNKREVLFCALGLLLGFALSGHALAGTNYFVSTTGNNTNPGTTRTTAWRTIQYSVDHVGPGDSIIVLAGAYTGAWIQVSGQSNAPITLQAEEGEHVLLNAKNPGGKISHDSILWMENWGSSNPVSHWIIQGFEIANSPLAGIDIRGSPNQPSRYIPTPSRKCSWSGGMNMLLAA